MNPRVHPVRHPLARHHLSVLRAADTGPEAFRRSVQRLAGLLVIEATASLPVHSVPIRTPMAQTKGHQLRGRVGLIPILRAGLGMTDAALEWIPEAAVWHLGFYRDEDTLQPVEYYRKFSDRRPVDVALVLDPMLATGGSALAALEAVRAWGVRRIKLLSLIASPEGIRRVIRSFPELDVHVCAVDRTLNQDGFILPGLGDAGDRLFNTPT